MKAKSSARFPRSVERGTPFDRTGVPNMFQQDYLMRLIWQFVEAMRRTVEKDDDPDAKAASVEDAIANALEWMRVWYWGWRPKASRAF